MTRAAADYGKVGVLMGGWSAEREISLRSGEAVLRALQDSAVDAVAVDVGHDIAVQLDTSGFDRVFNAMHGRGGEDGVIQGLLEAMQLPYTGSRVMASAITMDKLMTKRLWRAQAIPTPDFRVLGSAADCETAVAELGLPLIVKPVLEGSSIGMSRVDDAVQIVPAWEQAADYGVVIAEQWVHGGEYTAAILGEQVLPMIRLQTPHAFYDYSAKYQANDTRYLCPCGLPAGQEQELAGLMFKAFNAVQGYGWGRVDFMLDAEDRPWLIEVNTVPGMTDHSLVPMAAKQAGINFEQLVLQVLETSYVQSTT